MTTNTPSDELQLLIQLHQRLDQLEAHTAPASGMSWLMAAVIAAGLHYAALPALQASGIPFVTTKTNTVLAWEQQQADRLVSWLTGSTRPALHPRTGTHPDLKTLYDRAQALARADGFRISIREADRTPEKQAEYVKKGASKTLNSRHLPDANMATLLIGAGVFLVSQFSERVNRLLPGPLLGIGLSALAVWALPSALADVPVMQPLQLALPDLHIVMPARDDLIFLMPAALVVALLCMMQTAAVEQSQSRSPLKSDETASDFAAIGAGSLLSGLLGSFAVNSSPREAASPTPPK